MPSAGAIARRVRSPLSRLVSYSTYTVRRGEPVLVGPASVTPRETKPLSDLDSMDVVRKHVSLALLYRGGGGEKNPGGVIRRALGEALVPYYPLAGRVREMEGGKLVVDCTGEGVVLVQAEADVRLADLQGPPFPCSLGVEGGSGLLNSPLLLIQVTRLLCGGFVLALSFNHTICDGIGIAQFMNAVGELARGLPSITVKPVWSRELIKARTPPPAPATDLLLHPAPPPAALDMVTRCFNFSASDVVKMKKSLAATTFETLAAFLWRAHTRVLELPLAEDAVLGFPVNIRGAGMLSLPAGYYGNAVVATMATKDRGALCHASLGDLVAQVRLAKAAVTRECVWGMVDEMVRPPIMFNLNMWFAVSDVRRLGLTRVDLGWGEPVFAGPTQPPMFRSTFFIPVKDRQGEDYGVCVPVVLPRGAMVRFADEVTQTLATPSAHK